MFKRITKWLASILSHDVSDPDNPFPEFDDNEISVNLAVHDEAKRHGKANVPDRSATSLQGTEELIKSEFFQRFQTCHEKTRKKIGALTADIETETFDEFVEKLNFKPGQIKADFERISKEGKIDVDSRQAEVENRLRDFEAFRTQHKLTRTPNYPDSKVLGLAILGLIILAETAMNTYFFAKGSPLGLLGGFLEALVISAINVLVAYLVGNYVFRWIFHRSALVKACGLVGFAIYLAFLIAYIFVVTHYRDAFSINPDNAWDLAYQKITGLSFAFKDLDSILFMAFSAIFAVMALIDAFKLDDPYPGYGVNHRRLEEAKESLMDEKDEKRMELEDAKSAADDEIEQIKLQVKERKSSLNIADQGIKGLTQQYGKYMKSLEQGGVALIKEYQTNNKIHRTEPSPKYFDEKPDLAYEEQFPLNSPEVTAKITEELGKLDNFYERLEEQRVNQTNSYTSYLSHFTKHDGQTS